MHKNQFLIYIHDFAKSFLLPPQAKWERTNMKLDAKIYKHWTNLAQSSKIFKQGKIFKLGEDIH